MAEDIEGQPVVAIAEGGRPVTGTPLGRPLVVNSETVGGEPVTFVVDGGEPVQVVSGSIAIITGVPPAINSVTPFPITITWTDIVLGFGDVGDIVVTGGTVGPITETDPGLEYTATVTPAGGVDVTVRVPPGAAIDLGGNPSLPSPTYATVWDVDPPVCTITKPLAHRGLPFTIRYEWNEQVVNFTQSDVEAGLTNATVTSFNTITTGRVYEAVVDPDPATVTVGLAAGAAADLAGNPSLEVAGTTVPFDNVRPTTTLAGVPGKVGPLAQSFTVTVDFDEDVTGFDVGGIDVANASKGNFQAVSAQQYTCVITATGAGNVTVQVPADVAFDLAGNGNVASALETAVWDDVLPTCVITGIPANHNGLTAFTATYTFSEDVSGFDLTDVVAGLDSATAANFQNVTPNRVWTADITPAGDVGLLIGLLVGAALDGAQNPSEAVDQVAVPWDPTSIVTTTISGAPSLVGPNSASFTLTVDFSKDVFGFAIGDIGATNATKSAFVQVNPAQYTCLITADGNGDVECSVAADVAQDGAGRGNLASNVETATYDAVQPTCLISGIPGDHNGSTGFTLTYTFDKDVTGFDLTDINSGLTNATGSAFANVVPNRSWTALIAPDGTQDITIQLAAAAAADAVGNESVAVAPVLVPYNDGSSPSVFISGEPPILGINGSFTATITFSEAVTGFDVSDIDNTNSTLSSFQVVNASTYTVVVTATGPANVTLRVPADAAQDSQSNGNTPSNLVTVPYDGVRPAVLLSGTPPLTNGVDPFEVAIAFSEPVTGLALGGVSVTNGTASNLQSSDASNYTADITPDNTGNVEIQVLADAAQDAGGNGNTASNIEVSTLDNTPPGVALSGTPAYTDENSFEITVSFSENVTGFSLAGISATNAAKSNLVEVVANRQYTAQITPDLVGDIVIKVLANAAQDSVGNGNTESNEQTAILDIVDPTVVLTNVPPLTNGAAVFAPTATFSEGVFGLTVGEILVTNGTASNLQTTTPTSVYTFDVTPDGNGDVTVQIPAGAAQDEAGNDNSASSIETAFLDNVNPTGTIDGLPADHDGSTAFTATYTFNEDVTELQKADVEAGLGNATAAAPVVVTPNRIWTVQVTPTAAAAVTLQLAGGVVTDTVGNPNDAIAQKSVPYVPQTIPSVLVTGEPPVLGVGGSYTATATFSENVTGFTVGEIDVSNATLSAFTPVSGSVYTFLVTADGSGTPITVQVPAGAAQSVVNGNDNTISNLVIVPYDSTFPSVSITGEPPLIGIDGSFTATITFSEDVFGFDVMGITVGNAILSDFTAVNASTYTVIVTANNGGNVTLQVPAGVAQDAAGNGNTISNLVTVTYDGVRPTATISGQPSIIGIDGLFPVTITFSKDVSGFVQSDITVGNATLGNFQTVNASTYTVDVTADNNGNVTLQVPAGSANDAAGNGNTISNLVTVTYDGVRPSCVISGLPANHDGSTPFPATYTWNEDVTGFTLADINAGLTNATASNFTNTVANRTWTVDITPSASSDITVELNAGAASDAAGNTSVATAAQTVPIAALGPTCTLTTENPGDVVVVKIVFSEDVTGFEQGDLALTGSVGVHSFELDVPNSEWTALLYGSGTARVPAGVCNAAVGGAPNQASNVVNIESEA